MAISGGHEHMGATPKEERTTKAIAVGGSSIAAICGLAAGVLAILGLLGIQPNLFAAIATILVGAAFLIEGASITSRINKLAASRYQAMSDQKAVAGGMATESLGGLAGIVLGVLALMGISPMIMLCSAAIVYGASLLVEGGARTRLDNLLRNEAYYYDRERGVERGFDTTHDAMQFSSGTDVLIGLGGIVLGILALLGFVPLTLVLVSMLAFGCCELLSGSTLASHFNSVFSR